MCAGREIAAARQGLRDLRGRTATRLPAVHAAAAAAAAAAGARGRRVRRPHSRIMAFFSSEATVSEGSAPLDSHFLMAGALRLVSSAEGSGGAAATWQQQHVGAAPGSAGQHLARIAHAAPCMFARRHMRVGGGWGEGSGLCAAGAHCSAGCTSPGTRGGRRHGAHASPLPRYGRRAASCGPYA